MSLARWMAIAIALVATLARADDAIPAKRTVAAVVTEYRHNSHADVIVSRLLQTYTLDGKGGQPSLHLASLYTDQVPAGDLSRKFSQEYRFPIYPTVSEALTLGTGRLAVDGVLLVAEHGKYPLAPNGQTLYPKRRLFEQIIKVFTDSGRVVPLFIDKHLADNWDDAHWIYQTAKTMKIPLMAGSSLPALWRYPPADVKRGAKLQEVVALAYGGHDAYGFHACEMVQCLAERRAGGETGVRGVRCLFGADVWKAGEDGTYDPQLLRAALSCLRRHPPPDRALRALIRQPMLWLIEYNDGFKARIFWLDHVVGEWSVAWRTDEGVESTLFYTQEARPYMHFSNLVQGVERMIQTGAPTWPVERTLLTSGTLNALLTSKTQGGARLQTPHLSVSYTSGWDWRMPPPPPPDRPSQGQ